MSVCVHVFVYLSIYAYVYSAILYTSIIDLEWIRHLVNDSPPASSNKPSGHCTGPRRSSRWRRYSRRAVKPRKSWSSLRSSGSKPGSGDGFFFVPGCTGESALEKNIVNSHGAKVVYINVHAHTHNYIHIYIYYNIHIHTTYGIFEITVWPYIWLNTVGTIVSMNYDISIQWGWFSHLHDWFSTHKLIDKTCNDLHERSLPDPYRGEGGGGTKPTCRIPLFFCLETLG